MEEKLNGLSSTLSSTEFNHLPVILTRLETELANTIHLKLFIRSPITLTLLLEIVINWPLPFKLNLFLLLSMLVVFTSNFTLEESLTSAEPDLTTPSYWLDWLTMELQDTGLLKIHGEADGDNKDMYGSLLETHADCVTRHVTETLHEKS